MGRNQSKKIVFLDRDGVINKKAGDHCYVCSVDEFVFNNGIFEVLNILKQKGFEFIVLTNQRGIARGFYSEDQLNEIHDYMKSSLLKKGVDILDIFYCPHYFGTCDCCKPMDGMLKKAFSIYNISLKDSLIISDSFEDIEMGKKFGLGYHYYVESDKPETIIEKITAII